MLKPAEITNIKDAHQNVLSGLYSLEQRLRKDFFEMEEAIRALTLALVSGEPALFLGPPGTAKSMLIRRMCGYLGLNSDATAGRRPFFEYLLTPFTEPGELFGFLTVGKDREIKRLKENTILTADVVYLDEIFYASSAILNSLLAFLNERIFHDRGEVVRVQPNQILLAASNQTPKTPELRAFYDRFLIRCEVSNLRSHTNEEALGIRMSGLLSKGFTLSNGTPPGSWHPLLPLLPLLRASVDSALKASAGRIWSDASPFVQRLTQMVENARAYEVGSFSNRRIIRMVRVMIFYFIYRCFECNQTGEPEPYSLGTPELALLPRYFLDAYEGEEFQDAVLLLRDLAEQPLSS